MRASVPQYAASLYSRVRNSGFLTLQSRGSRSDPCFHFSFISPLKIQHPRTHLNRFDLVVTPKHDYYPLTPQGQQETSQFLRRWITPREPPERHVVLTTGALHQADATALRVAATTWHDELALLPKPLLVINIGGPTSKSLH